jgi:hypothetical protein
VVFRYLNKSIRKWWVDSDPIRKWWVDSDPIRERWVDSAGRYTIKNKQDCVKPSAQLCSIELKIEYTWFYITLGTRQLPRLPGWCYELLYRTWTPWTPCNAYRMAGNFRGVPIFVILVVDLQSRNFPPLKINAHRYLRIDEGRGQKHRGSEATCSLC